MRNLTLIILLGFSTTVFAQYHQTNYFKFTTDYGCIEKDTFKLVKKTVILNYAVKIIYIDNREISFKVSDLQTINEDETVTCYFEAKNLIGSFVMAESGCVKVVLQEKNKTSVYSPYIEDVINARQLFKN